VGCTVYFILLGHTIFPDIAEKDEETWEKAEGMLARREWPRKQHACSAVTVMCWEQQYESAEEVVRDLEAIERAHGTSSAAPMMPGSGFGELVGAGDDKPGNGVQKSWVELSVV
jgi:hypothetical protein